MHGTKTIRAEVVQTYTSYERHANKKQQACKSKITPINFTGMKSIGNAANISVLQQQRLFLATKQCV